MSSVAQENSSEKNFGDVPDELKTLARWVTWRLETRKGKETKVPYQVSGERADITKPTHWNTFEAVSGASEKIGFVLGDGIVGVDLDKCVGDDGALEPWAREIVEAVDSYAEFSVSGRGAHIIARGTLPPEGRRKGKVEIYDSARYFTVSGNRLSGHGIEERTAQLQALHAQIFVRKEEKQEEQPASSSGSFTPTDADVVSALFRSKEQSAKFQRLHRGDITGYSSGSEADLALCRLIAFYSQDEAQIWRIVRGTALYDEKWKRADYARTTIQKAIQSTKEFYRWGNATTGGDSSFASKATLARKLGDLKRSESNSEAELLGDGFLRRGGGVVFNGNTGIGKSSFLLQGAMLWSFGQPFYGITPATHLRTLFIQAENDEFDLCEVRDGVMQHLSLTPFQAACVMDRISIVFDSGHSGDDFRPFLEATLQENPCDLVVIDPALAYLGGESSSQKDVSRFLRNIIDPAIKRFGVGAIIVQHTAKPMRGVEKVGWQGSEFSYSSLGSVEWANWPRGVLFIRSLGMDDAFELMAPKRGRRLGWTDSMGRRVTSRHIFQNRNGDAIYWREGDALDEQRLAEGRKANSNGGKRPTDTDSEILAMAILPYIEAEPRSVDDFVVLCKRHLDIGRDKAKKEVLPELIRSHGIEERMQPGRHGKKYVGYPHALDEFMKRFDAAEP